MLAVTPRSRVLITVGSGGIEPWKTIELEGQEKTFGRNKLADVDLVWLEADSSLDSSPLFRFLERGMKGAYERYDPRRPHRAVLKPPLQLLIELTMFLSLGQAWRSRRVRVTERRVTFPYPSLHHLHVLRQIHYFRYVLENYQFDFLLKTTSTCFIDLAALLDYVDGVVPRNHYSGATYSRFGIRFVSGAGALFSRDVVEAIVANSRRLPLDYWEDVTIGKVIQDLSLADVTEHPRVDVPPAGQVGKALASFSAKKRPFVYRCKASDGYTKKLGDEIQRMQAVEDSINKGLKT